MKRSDRALRALKAIPTDILKQAYTASLMSKAAYGRDGFYLNHKDLIESKHTDTQVYAFHNAGIIHVVFRGTERKFKDILTDLMAFPDDIPYDTKGDKFAFYGFLRAYMSVCERVRERVKMLQEVHNTRVVSVKGHSLGGVEAAYCAADLKYWGIATPYCFTFGQPTPGNEALAESMARLMPNYYRFRNPCDLVSCVPLSGTHIESKIVPGRKRGHDINNYIENLRLELLQRGVLVA